jgi:hypothetical protein
LSLRGSFRACRLPNDLPESSPTRLTNAAALFGSFSGKSARHSTNYRADWTCYAADGGSGNGTSSLFRNRWNLDVLGGLRSFFVCRSELGVLIEVLNVLIGLQMYFA